MKLRLLASTLLAAAALLLWSALTQAYTDDIQPGEIVINEVMWGPEGTETLREWSEVKNVSSRDLDLGGCKFTDGTYTVTINTPTTVTAGSYFVFCRREVDTPSEVQECDYEYGSIGLNQGGDSITITCGVTVVDSINFGSKWPAGENDVSAMAFNLRLDQGDTADNAHERNDQGNRWCDASSVYTYTDGTTDLGTPGEKNDVCTGWSPNAVRLLRYDAHFAFSWSSVLSGAGLLVLGGVSWVIRRR